MEREDKIQTGIDKYNRIIESKVEKQEKIAQWKTLIKQAETECVALDEEAYETVNLLNADFYNRYSEKDLYRMLKFVEKFAHKDVIADFKSLIEKFQEHNLGVNDISQLQTYIKLYGSYVANNKSVLRTVFKALGGKIDG